MTENETFRCSRAARGTSVRLRAISTEFFRDYPYLLKVVSKAMNLKRKSQGKTPRADGDDGDTGLVCPICCEFCTTLVEKKERACICDSSVAGGI